jgi:hypothetical protein
MARKHTSNHLLFYSYFSHPAKNLAIAHGIFQPRDTGGTREVGGFIVFLLQAIVTVFLICQLQKKKPIL